VDSSNPNGRCAFVCNDFGQIALKCNIWYNTSCRVLCRDGRLPAKQGEPYAASWAFRSRSNRSNASMYLTGVLRRPSTRVLGGRVL
jgi:hypothetical protein